MQFVDTMSAGLDPSKVATSVRVYVAAGAEGGFDAVSCEAAAPARRRLKGGPT